MHVGEHFGTDCCPEHFVATQRQQNLVRSENYLGVHHCKRVAEFGQNQLRVERCEYYGQKLDEKHHLFETHSVTQRACEQSRKNIEHQT